MREETCPHCGKRGGRALWVGWQGVCIPEPAGWLPMPRDVHPSVLCSPSCRRDVIQKIRSVHEFSVCRNCGETAT